MAPGRDLGHPRREGFGSPSQHEESGAPIAPCEQVQETAGVPPTGEPLPAGPIDHIGKSFGVEMVLDVDRRCIFSDSLRHSPMDQPRKIPLEYCPVGLRLKMYFLPTGSGLYIIALPAPRFLNLIVGHGKVHVRTHDSDLDAVEVARRGRAAKQPS
jgi:hypothetical protein